MVICGKRECHVPNGLPFIELLAMQIPHPGPRANRYLTLSRIFPQLLQNTWGGNADSIVVIETT
jgi:hypothetical protein